MGVHIQWASLVAQRVKNLPAMQNWVQFLGWEDPLEEGVATHLSILGWRIPMDRGAWQATIHGASQRVGHDLMAKCTTYTMEHYSSMRKQGSCHLQLTTWMDLRGVMQSEITSTKKDIYVVFSFIYEIFFFKKSDSEIE